MVHRRTLDFRTGEEVIADITRLRDGGYEMTGNWSLTQICQHLSGTMNGGMDGFGFRLPWILRSTMGAWSFRFLLKRRKLGRNFPTFRSLKPTATDQTDDSEVIAQCIQTCQRVESFAGPIENYPLLNEVSVEDWRDFMWIHASHHLGFLVPNQPAKSDSP